jgi:hypothetical protein
MCVCLFRWCLGYLSTILELPVLAENTMSRIIDTWPTPAQVREKKLIVTAKSRYLINSLDADGNLSDLHLEQDGYFLAISSSEDTRLSAVSHV